jgi:hypothetical protein
VEVAELLVEGQVEARAAAAEIRHQTLRSTELVRPSPLRKRHTSGACR